MEQRWLNEQEWLEKWKAGLFDLQGGYLGFYSSLTDGYFREPWGFWVPLDDHIVHRGDGVFEAIRLSNGAFFDLDGHLARLHRSAGQISLSLPLSDAEIRQRIIGLAQLCGVKDAVLRLYVSRGPGSFTQNPYDCRKSQLYLALTPWKSPPERWYTEGAKAGLSLIPGKRPFEAAIKSCNYLQNVLQKKDAVDRQYDFTVCLNEAGQVLEGSTESFFIVTPQNEMWIPSTQLTLIGTTLSVVRRLAATLVEKGQLKAVVETFFRAGDVDSAKEIAFVGTTVGVCPVTQWEGNPVGQGQVGKVSEELGKLLMAAIQSDSLLRTTF